MAKAISDGTQIGLFPVALAATIILDRKHPYAQISDTIDWPVLLNCLDAIRKSKLKSAAGKKPHLRALTGALIVKGLRNLTYRDTEDFIRYFIPARYLCNLMDSDWTPDFTTIQDFAELMGEEGMAVLNEHVVELAVEKGCADPSAIAADLTAQEAHIPYPNEVGLMMKFLSNMASVGQQATGALHTMSQSIRAIGSEAKWLERTYRFFAKTTACKRKMSRQLMTLSQRALNTAQTTLSALNTTVNSLGSKAKSPVEQFTGAAKRGYAKAVALTETMTQLLPQIRSWWKSGIVATGKIVSLHMPEVYAIVRGKIGKTVEFGVKWGIVRLRGGFILATRATCSKDMTDPKFAIQSVDDHICRFGKAPKSFAYDRGAYSKRVIAELKKRKVEQIAVAPKGQDPWLVEGEVKEKLMSERSQTEGTIGSIKSQRYGFNRPRARSVEMM